MCSALFARPAAGRPLVDAAFPGGNIVIDSIDGDTVHLHQDLRDTEGDWFYWYFRVRGAGGRRLSFRFTRSAAIGARGPAVSVDKGRTWTWLGLSRGNSQAFTYDFPATLEEARFCVTIPYLDADLKTFLEQHRGNRSLRRAVLCRTAKGRQVELLEVSAPGGERRPKILLTARHHSCESIASFALEGLLDAALRTGDPGDWLRQNAHLVIVPFVDKDGVEDGDQGKNRRPRDHNRDYDGESIYPSVAAIRKLGESWAPGKIALALDLHCPWLRGGEHEEIHFVGGPEKGPWAGIERFGAILESVQKGPLPFRAIHNLPFGKNWNTAKNMTTGKSFGRWAAELPRIRAAGTLEIPYASAGGAEVTADSARALGHDLARSLKEFIQSRT